MVDYLLVLVIGVEDVELPWLLCVFVEAPH